MAATLDDALTHARTSMDALDDPENVEYEAIGRWLHQQPSIREGNRQWVFLTTVLAPAWQNKAQKFNTLDAATAFLRRITVGRNATALLRDMDRCTPLPAGRSGGRQTIADVAQMLFNQRLWVLNATVPQWSAQKTDPAVYRKLNSQNGTAVDFAYLGQWEGGQYLHGYVPIIKASGKVAGKSGMTIATGFDIGQKSEDEMSSLGFSQSVVDRLLPYANVRFKGKTRAEVLARVVEIGPVPVITKNEADGIDLIIHGQHLTSAIASWNARRANAVPAFTALPAPWQTVLFSRTFHQGTGMPDTLVAKKFYTAATTGKWQDAVDALRYYDVQEDWYKARVGKEADFLKTKMPPAFDAAKPK